MGAVEINLFGKDICGLTDRPNYIVGFMGFITRNILDLMVSLIEGGTYEVGKTCINDGEFFQRTFFYI